MEQLLKVLEHIYAQLEQIEALTLNQTTVLLQGQQAGGSESLDIVDVIEQMVDYKDELITELVKQEERFEQLYAPYRGKITDKETVELMQQRIQAVLDKKQAITNAEQNNVSLMQSLGKRQIKRYDIPQKAEHVAAAYKKQQNKS